MTKTSAPAAEQMPEITEEMVERGALSLCGFVKCRPAGKCQYGGTQCRAKADARACLTAALSKPGE